MNTRKESEILRAILNYLTVRKVFHFRINTQGNFNNRLQKWLPSPNVTKGVADIICLKNGKMICLEVKSETGKSSTDQILFSLKVSSGGGQYFIVHSVDDVMAIGL